MKSSKLKFTEPTKTNSRPIITTREWSDNENPTPLQFDRFIPWLCLQMHVPMLVTVERMTKADILPDSRRVSSTRSRSKESALASTYFDFTKISERAFSTSSLPSFSGANSKAINIKSYYNYRNQLVEVAIIDCPFPRINRKVIQAINLCLPFHQFLKKFVIKGQGLTETVLYELGKLLPYSNITDVCLDDTYLPEGNYYVLLEKINQLQNLSLCRCKVNDEVCKTITDHLNYDTPASKSLLTLDLTSNRITNLGASYLGLMLRKNRSLLYLNVSDNVIGDTGASHILRPFMLFSLTEDEEYELKKRRFKYSANKLKEYKKCEKEILDRIKSEEDKENSLTNQSLKPIKGKISKVIKPAQVLAFSESSAKEQAEKMTIENIGEFNDIFDNSNVTYKNGKLHCIGNLRLCYLNLAYNDIKYFSLKKLCEVLKYQHYIQKSTCKEQGLLKVVVDGNNIPVDDELLTSIEKYLIKAAKKWMRLRELNRSASGLGRKLQRKLVLTTS